jgi:hypothetical protein
LLAGSILSVEDTTNPVIRRIHAIAPEGSSVLWAIVSVALGAALIAATGRALEWAPGIIIVAAISVGSATWLAQSLVRAVQCVIAAIAGLAIVIAALIAVDTSLPAALHLEWQWIAYAWWLLVPLAALCFRLAGVQPAYGFAEVVGAIVGIASAVILIRRVDFHGQLLSLLVQFEDNQAWVSLVTQISNDPALGAGFTGFGPVVPAIIGLLWSWQGSSIPPYNAVYAAFVFAMIITPLVVVGLMRRSRLGGGAVIAVFAGLLALWALHVPYLLFGSYGHLSAIWAFLALVAVAVLVVGERLSARLVPVTVLLIYCVGAVWFPLIPLALGGLCFAAIALWRNEGVRGRISGLSTLLVGALVLLWQGGAYTLGVRDPGAVANVKGTLSVLYAAQGGTAALDGILQMLVLVGLVGLAFVPASKDGEVGRIWRLSLVATGYVAFVFLGAYALKVQDSYGTTKMWFVVGSAVAIALIAAISHLRLPPRAVVATVIALLVGSLFLGGTGQFLSRDWIGLPASPAWLPAITTVAAQDDPEDLHPLGCFSNDSLQAYLCTRWAAGLTLSGDPQFMTYRLQIVNQVDPTEEINRMRADGSLANSWLVLLDTPDADHAWGWSLIQDAGRVYDVNGNLMDPRPSPPSGAGGEE